MNTNPDKQTLIMEVGELVMPLISLMRQDFMASIKPFAINPGGAILLEHVAKGVKHPKELAQLLETVPPVVSAILAELEDKGLIQRHIDPEDRRRVQLSLSEDGKALHKQIQARSHVLQGERLSRLSPEELQALIQIFRKILEGIPDAA